MKTIGIIIGVLVLLALVFQGWVMYVSDVEEQPYEVIGSFDEVEIRHYPPARMASVQNPAEGSRQGRNNDFQRLAGYIFGGNSEKQEFAMTAPVHIHQTDSGSRMSFVLPEDAWNQDLPTPNDNTVLLHWSEDQTVAAIQYSGYSSPETYNAHRAKLIRTLNANGIKHLGDFRSLGYDPPFKVNDRRNEVIVSIDRSTLPKAP